MTEKQKQDLIVYPISEMYKIFKTSANCTVCDGKGKIQKGIFFSYRDPVHCIMYEDPANKDLL